MKPGAVYAALAALAQEPWCFPPDVLADLTLRQAEELYLKPAVERAERVRAESSGEPVKKPGHDWDDLPDKTEFVRGMSGQFPGTPEGKWEEAWEKMRKAREERRV